MSSSYEEMEKFLELIPLMSSINKNNSEEFAKDFVLYISDKYDYAPEIEIMLGFSKFLEFFYIFSGKTITFPNKKQIKDCIRDMDIYYSLKKNPSIEEYKNQAKKFGLTNQAVVWIVERVAEKLGEKPMVKDTSGI